MTDHLLVPMDSSPMAKRALEHALSTRPDARVTVLYVIDYIEESYSARALIGTEKLRERAQQRAEQLFEEATEIADEFDESIETEAVVGDPAREIVAYADRPDRHRKPRSVADVTHPARERRRGRHSTGASSRHRRQIGRAMVGLQNR